MVRLALNEPGRGDNGPGREPLLSDTNPAGLPGASFGFSLHRSLACNGKFRRLARRIVRLLATLRAWLATWNPAGLRDDFSREWPFCSRKPNNLPGKPAGFLVRGASLDVVGNRTICRASRRDFGCRGASFDVVGNRTIRRASRRDFCMTTRASALGVRVLLVENPRKGDRSVCFGYNKFLLLEIPYRSIDNERRVDAAAKLATETPRAQPNTCR